MDEFETEVKRLQHFTASVIDKYIPQFESTPDNDGNDEFSELNTTQAEILREYLLHVLQYWTPEERLKIFPGVKSKFILRDRMILAA